MNFYNSQISNHSKKKKNSHNTLIPNIIIYTLKKEKKKSFEKRVDPCDPRVDSDRHIILQVGYGLTPSLFPGRKTPTHTHIFLSGLGQEMGPGQILPSLVVLLLIMYLM